MGLKFPENLEYKSLSAFLFVYLPFFCKMERIYSTPSHQNYEFFTPIITKVNVFSKIPTKIMVFILHGRRIIDLFTAFCFKSKHHKFVNVYLQII